MKSTTIKVTPRENTGSKEAKRLRREGNVPCVMYGGKENLYFYAPVGSFRSIIYTPDVYAVNFNINGKDHQSIVKDIQFHPVNESILHIDFQELIPEKKVTLEIPVKFIGISEGVKNEGGVRITKLRKIKIQGVPEKFPDFIEVNVENLKIGDSIKVGELDLEGLEILNPTTIPIVTIAAPRTEKELESQIPVAEGEEVTAEGEEEAKEGEEGKKAESDKEGEKPAEGKQTEEVKAEGK